MKYFLRTGCQFYEDSWTYGDWRQYIVKTGDTTQSARLSSLPALMFIIGLTLNLLGWLCITLSPVSYINWPRAIPFVFLTGAVWVLPVIFRLLDYHLLVAVGKPHVNGERVL